MIEYNRGKLSILSDFDIRSLREEASDIDLFIPTVFKTLNLHIEDLPEYMDSRIQFTEVRNILVRYSTDENNNLCTIHFLKSIDLGSAIVNFVIDYKDHYIELKREEYSGEIYIKKKEGR